jgi:hypothetical protein
VVFTTYYPSFTIHSILVTLVVTADYLSNTINSLIVTENYLSVTINSLLVTGGLYHVLPVIYHPFHICYLDRYCIYYLSVTVHSLLVTVRVTRYY